MKIVDWDFIKMNLCLVVLLILVSFDKTPPDWISKSFGIKLILFLALLMNGSLWFQLLMIAK